jgi:hypothetical protein
MAQHYSIKSFFRDMPAALLARYFYKQGLLRDFGFLATNPAKMDDLLEVWLNLPESERKRMESEFQEIYALSRDVAMPAIIHEAQWQMREKPGAHTSFVEMFSALPNHFERAMVAFLDYHESWKEALQFLHADTLPYWRKRKGFPYKSAAVDDVSVQDLAGLIRGLFHRAEGRGTHCHIDCLCRRDLDYFFAYPKDYSKQSIEWMNDQFASRPHNPAFEIVYIWSEKEGSLDLNFRGDYKRIEPLQAMFAQSILNLPELPPERKDSRVYELNHFQQKHFAFSLEAGSGIENVAVKMLRMSSKVKAGDRITVEANANDNPDAVYELLAKIGRSVPLHLYHVTQVELTASVVLKAGAKARKIPVRITHPNSCSLKYDEMGEKLGAMLTESGIEPKEPSQGAETMTPQAALTELLDCLDAQEGAAVHISNSVLQSWPAEAVATMKFARLLVNARPASSIVCPGCERVCAMQVDVFPADGSRPPGASIFCDKPEEMGQLPLKLHSLERWKVTDELLAGALSRMLGFTTPPRLDETGMRWTLGVLKDSGRRADVTLAVNEGVVFLVAAHKIPVAEVVDLNVNGITLDRVELLKLADKPAKPPGALAYQPSTAGRKCGSDEHKSGTQPGADPRKNCGANKEGLSGGLRARLPNQISPMEALRKLSANAFDSSIV